MDDGGNVLSQGREGEVCVRGGNVTRGYINNPSANATAFHKGGYVIVSAHLFQG
jgi:long-subunit acyl-CoA synthetase (AMP-forming)